MRANCKTSRALRQYILAPDLLTAPQLAEEPDAFAESRFIQESKRRADLILSRCANNAAHLRRRDRRRIAVVLLDCPNLKLAALLDTLNSRNVAVGGEGQWTLQAVMLAALDVSAYAAPLERFSLYGIEKQNGDQRPILPIPLLELANHELATMVVRSLLPRDPHNLNRKNGLWVMRDTLSRELHRSGRVHLYDVPGYYQQICRVWLEKNAPLPKDVLRRRLFVPYDGTASAAHLEPMGGPKGPLTAGSDGPQHCPPHGEGAPPPLPTAFGALKAGVGVPQGSPLSAILAEMAMAEVRSRIAASVDGAVVVSHGDNLLALSPPGIQIAAFQMVLLDAVRCVLREGAVLEEHRKLWHGPPAGPFNYIGYEIRLEDGRHVTISSSARRWENIEERLLANIQDNPERWNRERVVSLAASHLARYRGDPYSTRRGLQLVAKGAVWVNDHPKKPAPIPDKCDRRRIYTDGAWDPSTRAGAWACVWRDQAGVWQQLTGTATWTTSNQMELRAVIEAGRLFENATALEIISDSTYVVTSVELHLARWRTSKWRKARGGRVRNTLLWRALVTELSFHDIAFTWTPGHAGNPGNERADAAAKSALKALVEGNPVAPPAIQTLR